MSKISDFNYERKSEARCTVTGHLSTLVPSLLLVACTELFLSSLPLTFFSGNGLLSVLGVEAIDFLVSLFIGMLVYGLFYQHLLLIYGQDTNIGHIFAAFKGGDRIIKVQALLALIDMLCFLPAFAVLFLFPDTAGNGFAVCIALILLGILVRIFLDLSLSQCYFLLADFEDMKPMTVVRTSFRMMKGNRMKLFFLKLSFLPLLILGLFSFGIADLWVFTYELSADASFYRYLTTK